jgi:hypothetical protein
MKLVDQEALRCAATHQFADERLGQLRQCSRGTTGEDAGHGSSSSDPHLTEDGRWWCVFPPSGSREGAMS